jgi:hypothetical protein
MIAYRWTQDGWLAVTSRSISLLWADVWDRNIRTLVHFGRNYGGNCWIGSPGGSIGCSVPNTHKVTLYGPAWDRSAGHSMSAYAFRVGWRDDQGFPHRPRFAGVSSPYWTSH